MGPWQPIIEDLRVDAVWNGDLSSPVNLEVSVDVFAKSRSHLSLIRNDHPCVVSAIVTDILKLTRSHAAQAPLTSPSHRSPLDQELYRLSPPFPNAISSPGRWQHENPVEEELPTSNLTKIGLRPILDATQQKDNVHLALGDQQQSAVNTTDIPLFSQTASQYEATSSRDSAFSPPPPPASARLTIPKRSSLGPDSLLASKQHSPTKQKGGGKDDNSPHSIRRRPVSLGKRPPCRPGGGEDITPRGRRRLESDVTKRRISRSAVASQVSRGRTQHRQSSLPGRMPKTEQGLPKVRADERQSNVQSLPKDKKKQDIVQSGHRDTTVRITRYAEAPNPGERLEKWLQDGGSEWHATNSPPSDVDLGDINSPDWTGPALSSSPTPSSRAQLPWTDLAEEIPTPTLVLDNGTISVFFQSSNGGENSSARFRIIAHVSVKLEPQSSGCHLLALPGLPLQSGITKGVFDFTITESLSAGDDSFNAYEKVAYVDENLCTHPLQDRHLCHSFALDRPFSFSFLCFEACRVLEPSDFEIDSDVHTRYDWEDLDGEGIAAEHSMICSIRLHPFLMWAEYAKFKLYLIGGPSGVLETNLTPGHRRIYLEGRSCDAEHELELSLTCPVADLQKTFTISWEQSLGAAPFEIWLPRISARYPKKLEDIFDLPHDAGVSITPRQCRKSRVYSMTAQEEFLKSSGQFYFFPENQHTPATIQRGLAERSGQFYDELTANSLESGGSTPINRGCRTRTVQGTMNLKSSRQARISRATFLKSSFKDSGQGSILDKELARDAAKPIEAHTAETAKCEAISFFTKMGTAVLHVFWWLLGCLVLPVRLLKVLGLVWLCFRAFDHEEVVQLENSITTKVKDAWNRLDFEQVELQGDLTDWKHLLQNANEGASRVIEDGHIGVLSPMDPRPDDVAEDAVKASEMNEDMTTLDSEGRRDQESLTLEETQERPPISEKPTKVEETPLSFLDRIDLALGWRPPAATW